MNTGGPIPAANTFHLIPYEKVCHMPVLRNPALPGRTIEVSEGAAAAHAKAKLPWVDVRERPDVDDRKDQWELHAEALGHDVSGLNKDQIIDLVGDPPDDSNEISDEED